MALEQQLRVPGPTPLPERVVRSQSRPMINHRGPEFAALMSEVCSGIQEVLRTRNDVLLYPSSGTGGLEAAVANLLSPGEKALFCSVGSFGDRWTDIAVAYGVDALRLKMPEGEAIDPEDVERLLAENPAVEKVFVTHNETSTGVTNDIPAIAAVVKGRGKLIAVDSVSGASCLPLETDALGLDVVVCGSQKGWMSPPGLAMIAVSKDAYAAAEKAKLPRWYSLDFSLGKFFPCQLSTRRAAAVYTICRYGRESSRTLQTLEQIRLQLVHGPEDPVRFGRFKSRRIIDAPR